MIESMHIIHNEIVKGESHGDTLRNRKIGANVVKLMEMLYSGQPRINTRVATAYRMMLEGYTESQMRNEGISKAEIDIAMKFQNEYAHRDMLRSSLAIELGVSRGVAQRLQEVVRTRQAV